MKLPSYKPPSREKIAGAPESAGWIDDYMGPRDSHIKSITDCLQGQASVSDNFNSELRTLKVLHGEPIEVTMQRLRGKPLGVSVINSTFAEERPLPDVRFRILDEKKVRMRFYADSDPGEPFNVTVIIWGS